MTTCAVGTGKLTCTVTYNGVPTLHVAGPTHCVMGSHFPGVESDMDIDFFLVHTGHYRRSIVFLSLSFVKIRRKANTGVGCGLKIPNLFSLKIILHWIC